MEFDKLNSGLLQTVRFPFQDAIPKITASVADISQNARRKVCNLELANISGIQLETKYFYVV